MSTLHYRQTDRRTHTHLLDNISLSFNVGACSNGNSLILLQQPYKSTKARLSFGTDSVVNFPFTCPLTYSSKCPVFLQTIPTLSPTLTDCKS